jgi:hypothetical protein
MEEIVNDDDMEDFNQILNDDDDNNTMGDTSDSHSIIMDYDGDSILSELSRVLHILTSIEDVLQEIDFLTTPTTTTTNVTTTTTTTLSLNKNTTKNKYEGESIWNKQELLEDELRQWKEVYSEQKKL